jgi:hypothetical protein
MNFILANFLFLNEVNLCMQEENKKNVGVVNHIDSSIVGELARSS